MPTNNKGEYIHIAPGKPFKQWKKEHPFRGPNKTTKTVKIIKGGEEMKHGWGVPGRGNAR